MHLPTVEDRKDFETPGCTFRCSKRKLVLASLSLEIDFQFFYYIMCHGWIQSNTS